MQFSCKKKQSREKVLLLQPDYSQIQDIVSIADCDSSFGKYVTEVRSYFDGSCYFLQKFADSDSPFIVKIDAANNGFSVDEKEVVLDTLAPSDVEMIRGHEIHKMSMNPSFFFDGLEYVKQLKYLETDHQLFSGIDRLKNPVELVYNKEEKYISKIEMRNPKDTSQTIEIFFDTWTKSNFGDLAKEIRIVQAKKDTFNFNFRTVKVKDKTGYNKVFDKNG